MTCQLKTGLFSIEPCGLSAVWACSSCSLALCSMHGRLDAESGETLCSTCLLARGGAGDHFGEDETGLGAWQHDRADLTVLDEELHEDDFTTEDMEAMERAMGGPEEEGDPARFES